MARKAKPVIEEGSKKDPKTIASWFTEYRRWTTSFF